MCTRQRCQRCHSPLKLLDLALLAVDKLAQCNRRKPNWLNSLGPFGDGDGSVNERELSSSLQQCLQQRACVTNVACVILRVEPARQWGLAGIVDKVGTCAVFQQKLSSLWGRKMIVQGCVAIPVTQIHTAPTFQEESNDAQVFCKMKGSLPLWGLHIHKSMRI
jgi:hypothetical protein